jgi:hypothetical protein
MTCATGSGPIADEPHLVTYLRLLAMQTRKRRSAFIARRSTNGSPVLGKYNRNVVLLIDW